MNLQDNIEELKILEIRAGSHLYGTQTDLSDEDYQGVFIPPVEYILGLKKVEEVDCSIKSKLKNGKNSKEAIDRKFYEIKKYIILALQNNPNILEMLYVNEPNVVYINQTGRELLNLRSGFLHQGLKDRFVGYALGQKKQLRVKGENYQYLKRVWDFLNEVDLQKEGQKGILEFVKGFPHFFYDKVLPKAEFDGGMHPVADGKLFGIYLGIESNQVETYFIRIGDLLFPAKTKLKEVKESVEERIGKFTYRKEMIEGYGYDLKFGAHLLRLLLEGKELMTTGNLIFPLTYRDELLAVRQGKYTKNQLIQIADDLEEEMKSIPSVLPKKPDEKKIENWLIRTLTHFINL